MKGIVTVKLVEPDLPLREKSGEFVTNSGSPADQPDGTTRTTYENGYFCVRAIKYTP